MKRWLTTTLALLVCSAALSADITIVQTTKVEGGMASMAASAGAGASMSPKLTTRMKGMRTRTDVQTGAVAVSTILDLATSQVIVLNASQKTATIASAVPPAPPAGAASPATPVTMPKVEASVTPTGKSQVIDGVKCDQFTFTTKMNMGEMSGRQMPPEAAAMMQGVQMVMDGSIWVAKDVPGAAEYIKFQKAAASSDMATAALGASGVSIPGMDKLMKAMSAIDGLTYLTEMTINIEGTGQMAEMMKQMGPMKVTTKVDSVSTDALSDDLFKVPEGYTVVKR